MSKKPSRYRWFVVGTFFTFMLLHQVDQLLIGPLTPRIMEEFHITTDQMGLVDTFALVVATIFYPIWGYLYDHYARPKLLALASFVWGATTWMSSIVKTFPLFRITRSSTGIDNSAYPGLYSLISDYFGPELRGKIYGILQLTQPIGYLLGMILALMVAPGLGWSWRTVFIFTGSLGIVLSIVIYFGVKEVPRGQGEPELEDMALMEGQFKFSWEKIKDILKLRTMWFIFLQGFAGVFPWNVITYWFFYYLEKERGYDQNSILLTMAPVILILASGYFIGGAVGDWMFKKTHKGRILVSVTGVLMGIVFMSLALNTPIEQRTTFFVLMCLTAVFIPLSSVNVLSTVYDITLPEVRSSAQAVESFVENIGAALAPWLAGVIAAKYTMQSSILWICVVAWSLCFVLYLGALFTIDKDINSLRSQMADRAKTV
ncbi:MAG: MFS transporter [Anaerolineales bacterium]